MNDLDETSDDTDSDWQESRGTSLKRKTSKSKSSNTKRPQIEGENYTNMFSELNSDEMDESEVTTKNNNVPDLPKPPPIFIPNIKNITKMINAFKAIINREFIYKTQRTGEVKVMVTNIPSYRKLVTYLESNKIEFHTYQIKQERAFRVVIKNLHFSTPVDDIKEELLSYGHDARNITNVKARYTKEPLSMFFIDLEPKENNKDIFDLKYCLNAVVKIEAPRRSKDLIQCYRCQQFGHTKSYCRRTFRCVKCGLNHATAECDKKDTDQPQCVHCLKQHTASYKGCEIYQKLLKKNTYSSIANNTLSQNASVNFSRPRVRVENNINNNTAPTYANIVTGTNNSLQNNDCINRLEILINKQIEMTNTLINMMSSLINKICQ